MNYRRLDVDLLHAAYVLFQTKNFATAATVLNCTPSAVSHKIKKLETRIGRKLFDRTTRSVRPTHNGEILAADAAKVLEAMDIVVRRFQGSPHTGNIKLALSEEWLIEPISKILQTGAVLHPGFKICLETAPCEDIHARIDDGTLDVAVTLNFDAKAASRKLPEVLVWVGDPEVVVQGQPVPLVVNPPPCTHRKQLLDALNSAQLEYDINVHAGSIEALRLAVINGLGVGAIPRSALEESSGVTVIKNSCLLPDLSVGYYSVEVSTSCRVPKAKWLKAQIEASLSELLRSDPVEPKNHDDAVCWS